MCIGNLLSLAALPTGATKQDKMGALFGNGGGTIQQSVAAIRAKKNPVEAPTTASFGAKQAAYKNALSAGVIR